MEEVPGIPGSIPPLGVYPPDEYRRHLQPEEWQSILDGWLLSIQYRLRLEPNHFSKFRFSQQASGIPFLQSYLHEYEHRADPISSGSKEAKLHHHCYFLLKRLLLNTDSPYDCSSIALANLLGGGSVAFHAVADWRATLKQVWKLNATKVKTAVISCKSNVVTNSPHNVGPLSYNLSVLTSIVKGLPECGSTLMSGVDYLEALTAAYRTSIPDLQKLATENVYYCLRSFVSEGTKHTSLLLDTLFDMKADADQSRNKDVHKPTLLSSLVCSTQFLRHLKSDSAVATSKRGQGLIDTLSGYRHEMLHLHPPPPRARSKSLKSKGKSKVDSREEMHIHQASKISEVHDLFPDLPENYILRLLDHFSDNVEDLVAGLLEPESLPADLRDSTAGEDNGSTFLDNPPDLAPRSTPPLLPQRKNKFDGDEFDRLQISSNRIHKGRKEINIEQESQEQHSRSKAAIMAALAAFDSDDDERDDSYDVADVGASVDNTLDSDEKRVQKGEDKNEEVLYRAWKANPELFARDSKTRLTAARRQLKQDTSMGDEQIEGWAVMMGRDPKMAQRLESKYSMDRMFLGHQTALQSTKWQDNASASDSQDESGSKPSDGRRVGQAGIRGVRTWNRGRGRGGTTAGPADDHATQLARKRKEQGRGRGGATHNRREGRAKKMGRGMGPLQN